MPAEYGQPLTPRELEIVALVAEGLTNREVAQRLYLSHNTVKVHLRNIFVKTGVASRTELTRLAILKGWVTLPGRPAEGAEATEEAAPAVETEAKGEAAAPPVEAQATAEAAAPVAVSEAAEVTPSAEVLAPWPWYRWAALVVALVVAVGILAVPPRSVARVASGYSGVVDEVGGAVAAISMASGVGWEELPPLPVRRGRLGLAAAKGRLYAVGGMTDQGVTGRLDVYDVQTQRWATASPRPLPAANVGAAAVGGGIFVPGGCDGQGHPHALSHFYDPDADVWTEVAPMPLPLCAYALTVYRGRVYLFGGWDGARYRAVAYVYDPDADVWQALTPPTVARGFGGAAALGRALYYVGGYDGQKELSTCEVYLPAEDRWEVCQSLLQPRGGLGVAAGGGKLFAIGGGWNDYNYLGFNERYLPGTGDWHVMETPLLGEWRNLGVVFWDTSLYVVGGRSGTDYLNRCYTYEVLPFRIAIPIVTQQQGE